MAEEKNFNELPDYVQTVTIRDAKGSEKILVLPKALDLERPKRSRTAFTKWQVDLLESTFLLNPYLIGEQRAALAKKLRLTETQVKVWYQNRRTKERKERGPNERMDERPNETTEHKPPAQQFSNHPTLPFPNYHYNYNYYYDFLHNMQSFSNSDHRQLNFERK